MRNEEVGIRNSEFGIRNAPTHPPIIGDKGGWAQFLIPNSYFLIRELPLGKTS